MGQDPSRNTSRALGTSEPHFSEFHNRPKTYSQRLAERRRARQGKVEEPIDTDQKEEEPPPKREVWTPYIMSKTNAPKKEKKRKAKLQKEKKDPVVRRKTK